MRKRTIKKYGNTWVIKLEPSDVKDFGLVEGDIVDIDDLNMIQDRIDELEDNYDKDSIVYKEVMPKLKKDKKKK